MIRTVLVAVNDSSAALRAAQFAVDLAAAFSARLVAVSVVDGVVADQQPLAAPGRRADADVDPASVQVHAARAVQTRVRSLADRAGVELDARMVRGRVVDGLLEQSRSVKADVVVVGRVDRPGVRLVHLGRTAEQILEFCDVPVVVVPIQRGGASLRLVCEPADSPAL